MDNRLYSNGIYYYLIGLMEESTTNFLFRLYCYEESNLNFYGVNSHSFNRYLDCLYEQGFVMYSLKLNSSRMPSAERCNATLWHSVNDVYIYMITLMAEIALCW